MGRRDGLSKSWRDMATGPAVCVGSRFDDARKEKKLTPANDRRKEHLVGYLWSRNPKEGRNSEVSGQTARVASCPPLVSFSGAKTLSLNNLA